MILASSFLIFFSMLVISLITENSISQPQKIATLKSHFFNFFFRGDWHGYCEVAEV
jgi:hypothetical protein